MHIFLFLSFHIWLIAFGMSFLFEFQLATKHFRSLMYSNELNMATNIGVQYTIRAPLILLLLIIPLQLLRAKCCLHFCVYTWSSDVNGRYRFLAMLQWLLCVVAKPSHTKCKQQSTWFLHSLPLNPLTFARHIVGVSPDLSMARACTQTFPQRPKAKPYWIWCRYYNGKSFFEAM